MLQGAKFLNEASPCLTFCINLRNVLVSIGGMYARARGSPWEELEGSLRLTRSYMVWLSPTSLSSPTSFSFYRFFLLPGMLF